VSIVMPRYNSAFRAAVLERDSIVGSWHNLDKEDYSIPFIGVRTNDNRPWIPESHKNPESKTYSVRFSPDTENEYQAIGQFSYSKDRATGTFITETGDYRFLEGDITNDNLVVSCFDGAHMFLFQAEMVGDSLLDGMFYSGKHYSEPWIAVEDPEASLRDPNSITYLNDDSETIEVDVMTLDGDFTTIDQEDFEGRVTIVQIFGSWCPNCYDENEFYKELYDDYAGQGFQVIPIAFEASDDFHKNAEAVRKQFNDIGITYAAYLGGKRNKKTTSEMFPMLNQIISYPTSVYIDKMGNVRKIHTGFYGPGTGQLYIDYVNETRSFIEELLAEEPA
ncbi:MAG: TlpA family protein disulfide reductase, partial [Flavobacteriales bacterium]|nr:TlpA family protein disulfide reductase [Flavobacteriales bacterium]